jgi:hypothetical protein
MKPAHDTNFRTLLTHDHRRLDALLEAILELTHANVQPELGDAWATYEDNLLSHLDAEEMFLIPALAAHDPKTAARILAEHAQIRLSLAEIGLGIDLHIVRETQMLNLAASLRMHAESEEVPLYHWADDHLSAGHLASLVRRILSRWNRKRDVDRVQPPRGSKHNVAEASFDDTLPSLHMADVW